MYISTGILLVSIYYKLMYVWTVDGLILTIDTTFNIDIICPLVDYLSMHQSQSVMYDN